MGPKKGGANRGGSKNPPKSTKPPEEGDYIVFSNAKDKPGTQNAGPKATKKEPSKGDPANGPADGQEQPKRPDTKKLIGGASWTGKLPVNVLAEHCQKQKWEKPEYTMVSSASSRVQTALFAAH
jgi:ATP-dependent RNA helicase DHX57